MKVKRIACLGLLLLGCSVDNLSLLILYNKAAESDCSVVGEAGLRVPSGVLDLEAGQGYVFNALVRNSVVAAPADLNRHVAFIEGADVELAAASTLRSQEIVDLLGPGKNRTQYSTADVNPGGGMNVVQFFIIDPEQAQALGEIVGADERVQILAKTRVFGTLDGDQIASPYYSYPITLCSQCIDDPKMGEPARCFGDQL